MFARVCRAAEREPRRHRLHSRVPAILTLMSPSRSVARCDRHGRRVPDAVLLVSSAKSHLRRLPPRLGSWLHSADAEVLAAAGHPNQAQRALAAAETRMPDRPPTDLPYVVLDHVHLARWRGSALAHLGDESAIHDLSSAVAVMDSTFTRAGAGLRPGARAGALSEIDQANEHLERAGDLANAVGSAR